MATISSNVDIPKTETSSISSPSCLVAKLSSLKRKRPPMIEIPNVLQELQADQLKLRDFTPRNDTVCFAGIGVGVFSTKGKKKFMEDTHKIVSCLQGNSNKGVFGVYDGHGGRKAAEFVAENLHVNILEMMKNCKGNMEREEAIKAAYLKTDQDFLEEGVISGACCVTALIEDQKMIVSNVGDCRAVLCRGGIAEALTTDHRAEKDDERKRIESKGGYVEFHRGAWRVHGILSVSRSIGDAHLKNWVVAEPGTRILNLMPDMEFLVLASDGLWEEVSNQEAVDIVSELLAPGKLGHCADFSREKYESSNSGYVNVSPSSKLRRVSLVKQRKEVIRSPKLKKTIDSWQDSENECPCEYASLPLKSRRISLVRRITTKSESANQENTGNKSSASAGLVTACKELANLAVSRGSLDDITVMIIDLNHFKCS